MRRCGLYDLRSSGHFVHILIIIRVRGLVMIGVLGEGKLDIVWRETLRLRLSFPISGGSRTRLRTRVAWETFVLLLD